MENKKDFCWIERYTLKTYPNRKAAKDAMGTEEFLEAWEKGEVFAIDRKTYEAFKKCFEP